MVTLKAAFNLVMENAYAEVDRGGVQYTTNYYPSGIQHGGHGLSADYAFGGKELQSSHSVTRYDFEARYYDPIFGFTTMDPLCEKYYGMSPYSYCAGNPVNRIDPDGRDCYETAVPETKEKQVVWTDYSSQNAMNENGVEGRYLDQIVAVFEGSRREKLGDGNNLFGKNAILAKATIYGKERENDIVTYDAFTMSSDFSEYGAIADGEYTVNYRNPGKGGALSSNWALNNAGPVDCLDGVNPSKINPYSATQKNGVYIHRSNRNGWAGGKVSTGCLLIVPSQYDNNNNSQNNGWNQFNNQLKGVSQFKLILRRL